MTQDAQGPQEGPQWDADVSQVLEAIAEALGAAVAPLARVVQDQRAAMKVITQAYVDVYESHAALLEWIDHQGARPN